MGYSNPSQNDNFNCSDMAPPPTTPSISHNIETNDTVDNAEQYNYAVPPKNTWTDNVNNSGNDNDDDYSNLSNSSDEVNICF